MLQIKNNSLSFPEELDVCCPICFLCFDSKKKKAQILPCSHNFCAQCVLLFKDTLCPICRKDYNNKTSFVENLIIREYNEKMKMIIALTQKQKIIHKNKQVALQNQVKEVTKLLKSSQLKLLGAYSQNQKLQKEIENLKKMQSNKFFVRKPPIPQYKRQKLNSTLTESKTPRASKLMNQSLDCIQQKDEEQIVKTLKNSYSTKQFYGVNKTSPQFNNATQQNKNKQINKPINQSRLGLQPYNFFKKKSGPCISQKDPILKKK